MSDVFAKRRPTIDLDEVEWRLGRPCSADQKDSDPRAKLLRISGNKDKPHKTDLEPNNQISSRARSEPGEWKQPDAQVNLADGDFAAIEAGLLGTKRPHAAILLAAERSTVEYKSLNARAPLLNGDFAAIEAGLLAALREQAPATVRETRMANALPSVDPGSKPRLDQDNHSASRHTGVAGWYNRSRRPRYVMVAILIVGMAGIAVGYSLNGRSSGPSDITTIKADNEPDKPQTQAMIHADVHSQAADVLSEPPEPSPSALDNGTKQPLDLPQVEEKSLPAESHAELDNGPPAAPVMTPAEAQTPAEPLSTPVESIDTAPQANVDGAPLPASHLPAAAKAPAPKAAGHVTKPRKPAVARHSESHGQPRQLANKAKATPVNPTNAEPAPIAVPKAETPTTQPNPATNGGPFGLVQSAVNSLTSTTAKLFEWGRN